MLLQVTIPLTQFRSEAFPIGLIITLSCIIPILQFRLAYVAPESRVVGAGDLVDHPKKIAVNYLKGFFLIDLFVVLPLPQVMI